jgi:ECM component-binding autotransporter adhesin
MTPTYKILSAGFAAFVALSIAAPQTAQAQDLNVTCDSSYGDEGGATNICDDGDMTEVEAAVNANAEAISEAVTALEGADDAQDEANADANGVQDQALADAIAEQADTDNAQDEANADANGVQDQALADAIAEQVDTDNAQDEANADANDAQDQVNAAANAAQDEEIGNNAAGVAQNLATNNTQQTQIDTNIGNIATNTGNIATNADNIATNSAGIALNAADIADLRTDLNQGLAMANAMVVFAPDPGSNFRMNVGTGFHEGETAFGVTGTGRINDNGTLVYFGLAGSEGATAGKLGVSIQW